MTNLPSWWPSAKPWIQGDCSAVLKTLPDGVIQTVVTSPPYWGLRDYGVEGQLGLEKTPEEYVKHMVEVFREVKRVLRDDGTLWLNLGDSYHGGGGGNYGNGISNRIEGQHLTNVRNRLDLSAEHLKPKDLVGIPWRVAFALQADGWYLRSDIIWNKPNPMPESVTDRPTKSHEYIFLLTKSQRYYYDNEAVKESQSGKPHAPGNKCTGKIDINSKTRTGGQLDPERVWALDGTRNARSVWTITTKPFKGAHFATFPPELPERCIKAGTSQKGACPKCGSPWERVVAHTKGQPESYRGSDFRRGKKAEAAGALSAVGKPERTESTKTLGWRPTCECGILETVPCVVLDPFGGSGTTADVAQNIGRIGLLIELNPEYIDLQHDRVQRGCKPLGEFVPRASRRPPMTPKLLLELRNGDPQHLGNLPQKVSPNRAYMVDSCKRCPYCVLFSPDGYYCFGVLLAHLEGERPYRFLGVTPKDNGVEDFCPLPAWIV